MGRRWWPPSAGRKLMKFKQSILYTDKLQAQFDFYTKTLGLPVTHNTPTSFTMQLGWTSMTFKATDRPTLYHYCFLIPSHHLDRALSWMLDRWEVIEIESERMIEPMKDWNARSFYFYDGAGNIAECIERFDLTMQDVGSFGKEHLLGLNELGLPCTDISQLQDQLSSAIGSVPWKGNDHRFGTHGDQEGLILLPNYKVKTTWFPTGEQINPQPFELTLEHLGKLHRITFEDEKLEIRALATEN